MKKLNTARSLVTLTALGLLVCFASLASADYVYDEAIDGDLPHPDAAFVIPFAAPNPNTIRFTLDVYSDGWIVDVGPAATLESFTLTGFSPDDPTYTGTFHIHDGPLTSDPKLGTANYSSFGIDMLGVDFFDYFEVGALGEGQYLFNFWNDNSPNPTMEFDLNITGGGTPVEATTWGNIKALYR